MLHSCLVLVGKIILLWSSPLGSDLSIVSCAEVPKAIKIANLKHE